MRILLIILFSTSIAFAEEMFFTSPNIMFSTPQIQNGSTPYLQEEIIEERQTSEVNFMQKLKMDLIEIHTLQVCA